MKWTVVLMILGCHSPALAVPAADPLDGYKLEKLTVTPEARAKDVVIMNKLQ